MKLLEQINKDTIIVCNYNNKKIILEELNNYNKLFPIKFLTLNELYDSMFFKYDTKTLYNVINKYNIKLDVAKVYLNNLIYINNCSSKKLDKLIQIKNYLIDNNLLIKDEYFNDYIKNKNIIFYGFDYIDSFMNKVINHLKQLTNVDIINKEYFNYKHNVIEFNHIEEEVEYVASSICKLISNNIDINNIKLTNINDEYYKVIKRIFNMYNIPIQLDDAPYLSSTLIGKEFINNYSSSLDETINSLSKYNQKVVNQITNIINKYTFVEDKLKVKDMILDELSKTKVKKNEQTNYVEIIDFNDVIDDQKYVFMLNFNQGSIPKIYKDEDYLTNKDKSLLGLSTSIELSKMIKEATIKNINSIKNLTITYKLESYNNNYFPSNLIEDMNLEVVHSDIDMTYSSKANKIRLCKDLDKYYKYNVKSNNLSKLYNNYNIPYRKYSNKFNGITIESLNKIIDSKLSLSYSSMQLYNECAFKYYINNILKLDTFENTFSAFIGTLFHHVLEVGIKKQIDVSEEVNRYISDKELNSKEQFFIQKLIKDITFALDTIKDNLKYTKLTNIKTENKFEVLKQGNITVTFKGFIDKMMSYKDDEKTYVALIDYKTYDTDINMDLIDYGLNIQLPIYLYLVNNNLKDVSFAGFYVQRILSNEIKYNEEESLENQKRNSMKLLGYSNSDENILELFDNSYKESNVIKGLKIKNDGSFMSSSHVLSDNQMKEIINKVDKQIDECINNIEKAKFEIDPKNYKDNNISCKWCKYKDICFMTPKDEVFIAVEDGDIND